MVFILFLLFIPLCFGMEKARAKLYGGYELLDSEGMQPPVSPRVMEDGDTGAFVSGKPFHLPGNSPQELLADLTLGFQGRPTELGYIVRLQEYWAGLEKAKKHKPLPIDFPTEGEALALVEVLAVNSEGNQFALDRLARLADGFKMLLQSCDSKVVRSRVMNKLNEASGAADSSMYQQGVPGQYTDVTVIAAGDPMAKLYPQQAHNDEPGKAGKKGTRKKLGKKYHYKPNDPYSLLFKLSRHFEQDSDGLQLVNGLIQHLHALDPDADHTGQRMHLIHESTPAFCISQLAKRAGGDMHALNLLWHIAHGIKDLYPDSIGRPITRDIEKRYKRLWEAFYTQPEQVKLILKLGLGPFNFSKSLGTYEVQEKA